MNAKEAYKIAKSVNKLSNLNFEKDLRKVYKNLNLEIEKRAKSGKYDLKTKIEEKFLGRVGAYLNKNGYEFEKWVGSGNIVALDIFW